MAVHLCLRRSLTCCSDWLQTRNSSALASQFQVHSTMYGNKAFCAMVTESLGGLGSEKVKSKAAGKGSIRELIGGFELDPV